MSHNPARRKGSALVRLLALTISQSLLLSLIANATGPSSDEILARLEAENNRRSALLKEYSGARQYTLKNARFGKVATTTVAMKYSGAEGDSYTISTRSGSAKLNEIIDTVLESEMRASVPLEEPRHQVSAANYRVRLLGTEVAAGRICYVLELKPKVRNRYLIVGKAWVDTASYSIVRIEGQFAASLSMLVGAPRVRQEYVEVNGFWLPGRLHSVASSLLLGPTELEIVCSDYKLDPAVSALAERLVQ